MSSSKLSNDSVTATSNFSIITQDGSGATKGGDISILPGDGGPTDGVGGDVTITAGSGAGTGKNGDVIITAPIVGGGADGIISLTQNGATSTWPDMSTLPAVGDVLVVSGVAGSTVTLSLDTTLTDLAATVGTNTTDIGALKLGEFMVAGSPFTPPDDINGFITLNSTIHSSVLTRVDTFYIQLNANAMYVLDANMNLQKNSETDVTMQWKTKALANVGNFRTYPLTGGGGGDSFAYFAPTYYNTAGLSGDALKVGLTFTSTSVIPRNGCNINVTRIQDQT